MKNTIVIVVEEGNVHQVYIDGKKREYVVIDLDIHADDKYHTHSDITSPLSAINFDDPEVLAQLQKEKYL